MNRKTQLGFGLGLGRDIPDLLWTLAIIGVLAAIAVPAYQDFLAVSRVAEALKTAAGAKSAVEKAFAAIGPMSMTQSGWKPPAATEYVQSITIAADGMVTLQFKDTIAPQGQNVVQIVPVSGGKALDLSAAAAAGKKFEWQCGGPAGKTTLPEKRRPKSCRE